MQFHFEKYQGTGNDFILIDNRSGLISLTHAEIARICDRHFGVGGDGLMLLEKEAGYDFRMVYYNSDGNESSMCGNGGRCMVSFARKLGIVDQTASFKAIDGPHKARLNADGTISLEMQNVNAIDSFEDHSILNTGSPHYVTWVGNVKETDVFHTGRSIRNRDTYLPGGINVNFVEKLDDGLYVRTYERGVEDETLSCGTGVTAAAIAASGNKTGNINTKIYTPGGNLKVSFLKDTPASAINVVLTGPATFVFEGNYDTQFISK